jgi:hypothetical protein
MASNERFYINLGGTFANIGSVRYGFRAPEKAYDEIGDAMGVVKVDDTVQGVMYGCNKPRPARVRIMYQKSVTIVRSTIRFCEPDKIGDVTVGSAINAKKVYVGGTGYEIHEATLAGSR